jgi:hypothetical protein
MSLGHPHHHSSRGATGRVDAVSQFAATHPAVTSDAATAMAEPTRAAGDVPVGVETESAMETDLLTDCPP